MTSTPPLHHRFLSLSILTACVALASQSSAQFRERERTYDVLHYALDVSIDEKVDRVEGTVTMLLVPLAQISALDVDAAEMEIRSVELMDPRASRLPLNYSTKEQKLHIVLPRSMSPQDTVSTVISYSCAPRIGLYFIHPDAAYADKPVQVWSQGEMEDNHFWFPCYDYPNDRATAEMHFTVNDRFTAISNGTLKSVTSNPDRGTKSFHWYMDQPIPSYLISVVVGDYVQVEDRYKNIPVQFNVYPSQRADALRSFSKTVDMIRFFSDAIGYDYPWPKYAQTVVADFTYGGMENVSATTLTDRTIHSARAALDVSSKNLVSHELAHQWFGDLLTCRNWSNAWLNEGFASYFQALYVEHDEGWDAFQEDMLGKQKSVVESDTGLDRRATVTDDYAEAYDLFDAHIYARGACILNMLRFVLGDSLFWKGINRYVANHQFGNVTTDDFQHAMEEASELNLSWFFQEWVYKAGYPVFQVSSAYDPVDKQLILNIKQTQPVDDLTPLFRMPVAVEVTTAGGLKQHRVMVEAVLEQTIRLSVDGQPLNVEFDKGSWLLKKLRHTKPREMWLYQLRHGDAAGRIAALKALESNIEREELKNATVESMLNDPFWAVRKQAAESLGKSWRAHVLPMLERALRDPEPKVRAAAAKSLANFRNPQTLTALKNLLEYDLSYAVQAEAISSLVKADRANGLEYCMRGLSMNSHNDVVRAAAAKALGTLRTPEAKKMLLDLTAYGQPLEVRTAAVESLAKNWHRDEEVRLHIERLVKDRDERVRRKALEELGRIASGRSIPVFQQVLKDEVDTILRNRARRSLIKIERAAHP